MLHRIVGNEVALQALKAALQAGRLSHSVLFCGEKGTGTGFAARCLAAEYLYPNQPSGANSVLKGQAEECIQIKGEGASGEIRIERIRQIRQEVFKTSLTTKGRVVILYGAENLNSSSGNALLKILEEPPKNLLFILTACSPSAVLSTIRSRCVQYSFCPVSESECTAYLQQYRPNCRNPVFLSQIFGGKIGSALECVDQPLRKGILDQALRLSVLIEKRQLYAILQLFSQFETDKPNTKILLQDLQAICAARLKRENISEISISKAAKALPILKENYEKLHANASLKLLLTVLGHQLCQL